MKAVWPTDELPSDVLARDGSSYLQVLEDLFLRVSLILSLGYLSVASLKQPRPREAPHPRVQLGACHQHPDPTPEPASPPGPTEHPQSLPHGVTTAWLHFGLRRPQVVPWTRLCLAFWLSVLSVKPTTRGPVASAAHPYCRPCRSEPSGTCLVWTHAGLSLGCVCGRGVSGVGACVRFPGRPRQTAFQTAEQRRPPADPRGPARPAVPTPSQLWPC